MNIVALTGEMFMLDLASRLQLPSNGQANLKPQLSTDGFSAYPGAVDLAFSNLVQYGQIIKDFQEGVPGPGRYGPPRMISAGRREIIGTFNTFSICTSHVERHNLSVRTFVRRFTRLSLGFSKKIENLAAAFALHVAYHNFCRRHSAHRLTPAMKAGVTDRLWSLEDLMEYELQPR